ncbi:MAG TPA: N(4)-(beta-N-acetylglucosaminyl)-L-asparaginase [Burkholderiales bacterium]|nr:N(4)-(beta-N-acetylglucosaminyl)-L-asparaginase [Burkholderiales bacterium]
MLLIANYEGRSGTNRAAEILAKKENGLRAIIEGIKIVEANLDIHTVGMSSWPNILGELQLDAAVMDGTTRRTGAVGALRNFKHPVEVAYRIMTDIDHEILVGEGAERFAREIGADIARNETELSINTWHKHLNDVLTEEQKTKFPEVRLLDIKNKAVDPEKLFDTTVYLSIDHEARISSATSTSGWAWKYPGRLGDSPIIGAGSYADSRFGACACTHTGEMAVRAGTARSVVLYLKMGLSVADAVYEAARDLADLKTGYLDEVTIHAIDKNGNYKVIGLNSSEEIRYVVWQPGMATPEVKSAEIIRL